MTHEAVCLLLATLGGKEYPDQTAPMARSFDMGRIVGAACECNDRPPSIHVQAWPDVMGHPGSVIVRLFGEAGGRWTEVRIYSIPRDEIEAALPKARRAAAAMWAEFVVEMRE